MSNDNVHRLGKVNGLFGFTVCGIALHIHGGLTTNDWKKVTCKRCLARKVEFELDNIERTDI